MSDNKQDLEASSAPSSSPVKSIETVREVARAALAEFVASAIFIFTCCGAAIATTRFKQSGNIYIEIAMTFGFALVTLCYAIGHISGGHLNCVVSFCFAFAGKITWLRAIMYFFAQWLGGMVGAGFLRAIAPTEWAGDCLASNSIGPGITAGQGLVVEIILTFFLMLVVNAAADASKSNQMMVPVAIGFSVTVSHLVAIPLTGTSLNPTRSFASAAASNSLAQCSNVWNNHWVFWLGPMLGGILATIIYQLVFLEAGQSSNLQAQYKKDDGAASAAPAAEASSSGISGLFGRKKGGAQFDDVQAIQD